MPPIVWPIEANHDEPIRERYGYQTSILAGQTRREQRRKLKRHPSGAIEFSIFCTDQRDPPLANGLLLGNQGALWAAPLWHYGTRLTADVASAAASIPVVTANLPFQDIQGYGQYLLLWRDARTWALHQINVVSPTAITLLDVTTRTWAQAGTYVVPVRPGRLEQLLPLSWSSSRLFSARLKFSFDSAVDAVAAATVPAAAVTYQGIEVLEKDPDGENPASDSQDRSLKLLGTMGARAAVTLSPTGAITRPFRWKCQTRGDLAALRLFLDRRMGRLNSVWIPSGEVDLIPTSVLGAGVSAFDVTYANYSAGLFPSVGSRRHLAFIPVRAPGTRIYRKVLTAVDNGDGTEHITIDSALGQSVDPATWVVSFNRLCRQAEDEVEFMHLGNEVSDTTISFLEVPLEAPL